MDYKELLLTFCDAHKENVSVIIDHVNEGPLQGSEKYAAAVRVNSLNNPIRNCVMTFFLYNPKVKGEKERAEQNACKEVLNKIMKGGIENEINTFKHMLSNVVNDPVLASNQNQFPGYKVKIIERDTSVSVIVDSFSEEPKSVILRESKELSTGESKESAIEACCRQLFFTIFLRGAATLHSPWSEPFLPENMKKNSHYDQ